MSQENGPAVAGMPPELMAMLQGMVHAITLRQAHASFAAHALQGLIVAHVQPGGLLNGSALVADAWRFADAMLAAQQQRDAEAAEAAGASSLASVLAQGSA